MTDAIDVSIEKMVARGKERGYLTYDESPTNRRSRKLAPGGKRVTSFCGDQGRGVMNSRPCCIYLGHRPFSLR
jgi:hypothetical protein